MHHLKKVIGSPAGTRFCGKSGRFAHVMAEAVVRLQARSGGLLHVLDQLVEARMGIAVEDGDYQVVATLADFQFNRAIGGKPHKSSFTTVDKRGPLSPLYDRIERRLFHCKNDIPAQAGLPPTGSDYIEDVAIGEKYQRWRYRISPSMHSHTFYIYHAANKDVPAILRRLNMLWDNALTSDSLSGAQHQIAEFEWLFMAADVPGRCGAAIGDASSLVLQKTIGITLREKFMRMDWEVLSRPLMDYVDWRISN